MTHAKICCIASQEEAEMAAAAGARAIGLVGAMPSGPGPIADDLIARIAGAMRGRVLSVLLSAETTAAGLVAHVARCLPDAVQIVDAPRPGAVAALRRAAPGVTVIRVIHVGGAEAEAEAAEAARAADMLLLDSGVPARRELGGTGRVHDWAVSARIVRASPVPVWLAGGLGPANAARAVAEVGAHGLDVCSGLRPGGRLDPGLLGAFMAAIRGGVCRS